MFDTSHAKPTLISKSSLLRKMQPKNWLLMGKLMDKTRLNVWMERVIM